MSEHKIFIKRVALVGVVKFITGLRGLILLPILAKTIGTAGYGIWTQILITVGFLVPFATLNLSSSMVRFLSAEKIKENTAKGVFTVIFSILIVGASLGLVLFIFSGPFAAVLLRDPSASLFIKIAGVLLALEALDLTCLEPFRMFGQIKRYSYLTVLQTVLEIALVAFFVFHGFGLAGALIAFALVRIIILIFSLSFIISHTGFSFPDFSILVPYLAFALPLIPSGFLDTFVASSDRYIVGFFKGASAVGIYSAAYGVGLLPGIFIFPICYILSPTIFKLFDDKEMVGVKTYMSYSLKYFLLFAIPSVFGVTVLAKSLLKTLTTYEFVSAHVPIIVLLVALGAVFYGIQAIFGQISMMFRDTKFFMIAWGAGAVINFGLNIILVPYFGIMAAAATTLIAYFSIAALIYFRSFKYMTFSVDFLFVIKSIAAASVMAAVIYIFNPIGTVKILLAVGIGVVIYFCLLFILQGFKEKELKILGQTLKLDKLFKNE